MINKIDWGKFQNKFLKIEPGTQAHVTLSNWRQEQKTFNNSEKERTALVFDVLKVNDVSYKDSPLEWSTTSAALAHEFKRIIELAENRNTSTIFVIMKRNTEKKYTVIDLYEPREEVPPYVE